MLPPSMKSVTVSPLLESGSSQTNPDLSPSPSLGLFFPLPFPLLDDMMMLDAC